MANPIRRLVRLVFDRGAAARTEKSAKKSLGRVEQGFKRIRRAAVALGGTLAAAFGVRAITRFGKESVRVAAEATQIWGRLEQAVESTGISFASVQGEIVETAAAMQEATAVGDEDFADILAELITTSGDYERSLDNVQTVADLAAAKNLEFRSAAQLVGRAMVGQTATLTRYGIVVGENDDAMEVLRSQFAGFAENEATTFDGKLTQLTNRWDDFRQAVGDAIIMAGGGTSSIDTLAASVKVATEWVNENREALSLWGTFALRTIRAVVETVRVVPRVLFNLGQGIGSFLETAFLAARRGIRMGVNGVIENLNKIPGVDIDFRMNQMSPEEWAEQQERLTGQMDRDFKQIGEAVQDLGQSYRDMTISALEAATAQERVAESGPDGDEDSGPGPGDLGGADFREAPDLAGFGEATDFAIRQFDDLRLSLPTQVMADMNDELRTSRSMAELMGEGYAGMTSEAATLETAMRRLIELGLDPTDRRMQALAARYREVQKESQLAADHQQLMQDVAGTTGEILNAAMGAGIGRLAEGKAKQNAIMAAEQVALGLVASLNPFTAPKAAGHYSAAAQFGGIAAAWGALAGATGGGGGVSRAGVGGFNRGRGAAARSASEASPPDSEVHIHFIGEGFSAVNPEVQKIVTGALQESDERFGNNARVKVHNRTTS